MNVQIICFSKLTIAIAIIDTTPADLIDMQISISSLDIFMLTYLPCLALDILISKSPFNSFKKSA
ncbi:MAG: hypothetical protein OXF30_02445 [Candidatus Saccharibacteria bacterium]|nr:hypothetical protein [Candidatus Saccharibacteria bacterium]